MGALQGLQPANLAYELRFGRPGLHGGRWPQAALTELFPPPRQHERVNIERFRDGLDGDPWPPTQLDRGAFELLAVLTDFYRTDATGHRHLLALGGSVYFIEGGSAVSFIGLLASR